MNIWGKILYRGTSKYSGEVYVVDFWKTRRLVAGGFTQSRNVQKGSKVEFYWSAFVPDFLELPNEAKVLIIGFAAGTMGTLFRRKFPKIEIDGVEIDPLMIELGRKYFNLDESKANIFVEDGESFVKKCKKHYDLVCVDIFWKDQSPQFVSSKEFIEGIKKIMKPSGIIILNKIYESRKEALEEKENFSKEFKFMREKHSPFWQVPGNLVLYGSKQ